MNEENTVEEVAESPLLNLFKDRQVPLKSLDDIVPEMDKEEEKKQEAPTAEASKPVEEEKKADPAPAEPSKPAEEAKPEEKKDEPAAATEAPKEEAK